MPETCPIGRYCESGSILGAICPGGTQSPSFMRQTRSQVRTVVKMASSQQTSVRRAPRENIVRMGISLEHALRDTFVEVVRARPHQNNASQLSWSLPTTKRSGPTFFTVNVLHRTTAHSVLKHRHCVQMRRGETGLMGLRLTIASRAKQGTNAFQEILYLYLVLAATIHHSVWIQSHVQSTLSTADSPERRFTIVYHVRQATFVTKKQRPFMGNIHVARDTGALFAPKLKFHATQVRTILRWRRPTLRTALLAHLVTTAMSPHLHQLFASTRTTKLDFTAQRGRQT